MSKYPPKFNHSLDYNPASDVSALDQLWREQKAVVDKRQEYLSRHADKIQHNHNRGMSRQALIKIYGEEAVTLAIGYPPSEKGK